MMGTENMDENLIQSVGLFTLDFAHLSSVLINSKLIYIKLETFLEHFKYFLFLKSKMNIITTFDSN